ncbi:hypothetical protein BH11MYX4_BH11MYX4_61740 [soil metagenome]
MKTAARPRKPRDAEASRRKLLAAAQKEFAAKGFAGARLLAITRSARIKPGLIHFHFADKEGLYAAVLAQAFAQLEAEVATLVAWASLPLSVPAASDLTVLGEALVGLTQRFYAENGQLIALLRNEAARGSAVAKRIATKHLSPIYETVIARIELLRVRGVIAADIDARHLFVSVVSMTAYASVEPLFVQTVWPDGPSGEALDAARRSDIVATALARMLALPRRGSEEPESV